MIFFGIPRHGFTLQLCGQALWALRLVCIWRRARWVVRSGGCIKAQCSNAEAQKYCAAIRVKIFFSNISDALYLKKFGGIMEDTKDPIHQGALDGLCGLYAIINACNNIDIHLKESERQELFKLGICYLDEKKILKKTLLNGMVKTHVMGIIDAINPYFREKHRKTLMCERVAYDAKNITGVWNILSQSMELNKAAAIVGLSGMHDHWTCVVNVTDATLQLCDSDGLKQIYKRHATCGETNGSLKHVLSPREVFVLRAEPCTE